MCPGPLRLLEIYEEKGMGTTAFDIFANYSTPNTGGINTVMFIKSGCQLMLQRMVREGKLAAEQAEESTTEAIKEAESGDLYLNSALYFIVGKKLEAYSSNNRIAKQHGDFHRTLEGCPEYLPRKILLQHKTEIL